MGWMVVLIITCDALHRVVFIQFYANFVRKFPPFRGIVKLRSGDDNAGVGSTRAPRVPTGVPAGRHRFCASPVPERDKHCRPRAAFATLSAMPTLNWIGKEAVAHALANRPRKAG